jgi:tyrosinase
MPTAPVIAPTRRTSTEIRHRKSVYKLNPDQAKALRAAVKRMVDISRQAPGDNRGWWAYSGIHGYPQYKCKHSIDHTQWARLFLPWHRAYLYRLELQMQTFVPRATLPWWDWPASRVGGGSGVPPLYGDQQADGAPNPLYSAPAPSPPLPRPNTDRHPQPASALPSAQEVDAVLQYSDWHDFSYYLESLLHNRVHGWTGGFMGQVPLAAYDPIFFAHHTMVDRLWTLWQVRHAQVGPPPEQFGIILEPFNMTIGSVLDTKKLGYDYAASTFHLQVG